MLVIYNNISIVSFFHSAQKHHLFESWNKVVSFCLQNGKRPANLSYAQTVVPTIAQGSERWNDVVAFEVLERIKGMH